MDDMPFAAGDQRQLEPDFQDVYHAWKQTPTPDTRHALLKSVDPVIRSGMQAYGGPSVGSPTLYSQARRVALQSFDTYDPARGGLRSHVLNHLRRLQRLGAQQAQIISVPERVAMDRRHLEETESQLRDALGRDPSDIELANRTGLSLKRLQYVRQARHTVAGSQIERDETSDAPASTIPGQDPRQKAWEQLVYYDLQPLDQTIFDMTLGRNGRRPHTVAEIAAKLGVTPSAISQRTAKIQAKLDERFTQNVL